MQELLKNSNVSFLVDELIWGHRLYDEQLPHLTVLEFLNVLLSNKTNPLKETSKKKISYHPQNQLHLRNILFNNPYIEVIRSKHDSDDKKWEDWSELYKKDATESSKVHIDGLRRSFESFNDFARIVDLLRSSSFESKSNKRWSSRFVFPFGPNSLYEDLKIDQNKKSRSNDRRFFARTGELLYLMLCRSDKGSQLGEILVERLFNADFQMDNLVGVLQGKPQYTEKEKDIYYNYLPHVSDPRFNRLCEDWLAVLSRDMPIHDGLEHLITITGLNLILYFLEQGMSVVKEKQRIELLCEIVSQSRTKVRNLSIASYQNNQSLSVSAIESFIYNFKNREEWNKALKAEDSRDECFQLIKKYFNFDIDEERLLDSHNGDDLLKILVDRAKDRHSQHWGKIHNTWARAIGLTSRRSSQRVRYAPNDRLLKTLVITVVDESMEFSQFLAEIHQRYGIVIGHVEGSDYIEKNSIDQADLMDNASYLETRLLSLGLIRRLSDSCAFVENPFIYRGED